MEKNMQKKIHARKKKHRKDCTCSICTVDSLASVLEGIMAYVGTNDSPELAR